MAGGESTVGIPWYRRRDYERILAIMADRAQLPRSYETWRNRAEFLEQKVRDSGRPTVRLTIDPKAFSRWCSANRLNTNAHARLLYIDQSVRGEPSGDGPSGDAPSGATDC